MTPKKRITVRLSPAQLEWLDMYAEANDWNRSFAIGMAIEMTRINSGLADLSLIVAAGDELGKPKPLPKLMTHIERRKWRKSIGFKN